MNDNEKTPDVDDIDFVLSDTEFLDSLRNTVEKGRKDATKKIQKAIVPKKQGGRPHVSGRESFHSNLEKKGYRIRKIRRKKPGPDET